MNDLVLNVSIETISAALLLVIIISQCTSTDKRSKAGNFFLTVQLLLFTTIVVDIVSWLVDEKAGVLSIVLAYGANFISYLTAILVNFFFVRYIGESIPLKGRSKSIAYGVSLLLSSFFIVLLVISQFNGILYYIDADNVFYWGPLYWAPHLIANFFYMVILWAVFVNRKSLGCHATLSYISYAVIPLIADLINIYFYQLTIGYVAMSIALLIVYVNIQMQRERKMREQELTLQNQEMALKLSQIQPHFVFNTLAAIKALYKTDAEQGEAILDNFASHLRTMISTSDMPSLIYLRDELRIVNNYLAIEQQRFKNRFEVEYEIGEQLFHIPPLTLQPIVENAVLHGLMKVEDGGRLVIRTEETLKEYRIVVSDNGAGFDPSKPMHDGRTHVGIENVRFRLKVLCNGQLLIESKPGEGTRVKIVIPKGGADAKAP